MFPWGYQAWARAWNRLITVTTQQSLSSLLPHVQVAQAHDEQVQTMDAPAATYMPDQTHVLDCKACKCTSDRNRKCHSGQPQSHLAAPSVHFVILFQASLGCQAPCHWLLLLPPSSKQCHTTKQVRESSRKRHAVGHGGSISHVVMQDRCAPFRIFTR